MLAQKSSSKEQIRCIEESIVKKGKKEMYLVIQLLERKTFSSHTTNIMNSDNSQKEVKTSGSSINVWNLDMDTIRVIDINNLFTAYNFLPPFEISKQIKTLPVVHPKVEKGSACENEKQNKTVVSNEPGEESQQLNLPKSRPVPGLSPFYYYDQLAYQARNEYFHVLHEFKSKLQEQK